VENAYNVGLAIIDLEEWLDTLDADGVRSVMILSGYEIGQIKL
jgi:hypothetical protein